MKEKINTIGSARKFIEQQQYIHAEAPQILGEIGRGDVRLMINVATHGNEVMPVMAAHRALNLLQNQDVEGRVRFAVANPPALRGNKRFVESDLNRVYPGKPDGTIEEKLANAMFPIFENVPYVVDMHTNPQTDPFVVAVTRSSRHLELAEAIGMPTIALLTMKPEPHSMAQFAKCGVGVELGHHDDPMAVDRGVTVIKNVMEYLGMLSASQRNVSHDYYAMMGTLSRDIAKGLPEGAVRDLQPLPINVPGVSADETLYPLLCDPNRTFADHYSLLLRKVSRGYLAGEKE